VVTASAISIVPLADDEALHAATAACSGLAPDLVIATTGIGFRGWLEAAGGWGMADELRTVLGRARLVACGPKPCGAIRAVVAKEQLIAALPRGNDGHAVAAADLLDHRDRLLTPLVRTERGDRRSPLREAGRGEALTNEKAYALGKFVRVALRSASIDYNGRFCMSSAATAAIRALDVDRGLPFPPADVAQARTVLLRGVSDPAEAFSTLLNGVDRRARVSSWPPGSATDPRTG